MPMGQFVLYIYDVNVGDVDGVKEMGDVYGHQHFNKNRKRTK
jgi:hypothetical protein